MKIQQLTAAIYGSLTGLNNFVVFKYPYKEEFMEEEKVVRESPR